MRIFGAVVFGVAALLLGGPAVATVAVALLPILSGWIHFVFGHKVAHLGPTGIPLPPWVDVS